MEKSVLEPFPGHVPPDRDRVLVNPRTVLRVKTLKESGRWEVGGRDDAFSYLTLR